MRFQPSTSQESMIFSCDVCRDTGWIETSEKAFKRCSCVEKQRMERLWQQYGVKPSKVKKINNYIPHDALTTKAKERAVEYVKGSETLVDMENNWFALLGQPGAGKSHLVMAIGAALLNKNLKVVYMPYTEVIKELKGNANNQDNYEKLMSRYQMAEVLVIDDLFKDKVKNGRIVADLSDVDIKHIYPLLNYRYYNSLPTVISSECTPEILINLDEALGGRILERCITRIVFKGNEYDFRIREFCK